MIPVLYESTETEFLTNGIGRLSDAISCIVSEALNGSFELEMEYPINGIHFSELKLDRIIYAEYFRDDPTVVPKPQPFEIYKITRPINGVITIYAHHISYRGSYIPTRPMTVETGAYDFVTQINNNDEETKLTMENNPFTLHLEGSDWGTKTEKFKSTVPRSYRDLIGGDDSFLTTYGGEIKYDNFDIHIYRNRGSNKHVNIMYSKNLTDLEHTEDGSSIVTGIYPYYTTDDGYVNCETIVPETNGIIYSSYRSLYATSKTVPMSFNDRIEETPTAQQLKEACEKYMEEEKIGEPSVNMDVSFVALWQTEDYKDIAPLETVSLGDTVTVIFNELGVNKKAKVIETVYNVLSERYDSIELGEYEKSTLDKTIIDIQEEAIDKSETKTREFVSEQTNIIRGAKGGYIKTITDANGNPQALIIGQEQNPQTGKLTGNCMKITYTGIGISSDGEDGEYDTAWTLNDGISRFNADYIRFGQMDGDRIKANTIKSGNLEIASSDSSYVKLENTGRPPYWAVGLFYSLVGTNYIPLTEKPGDWDTAYYNYYVRNDGNVFGSWIRLGHIVTDGQWKPTLEISSAGSVIHLVETNDRLSFYDMTDEDNPLELAFISDNRFHSPNMSVENGIIFANGHYELDQSNGLVFAYLS